MKIETDETFLNVLFSGFKQYSGKRNEKKNVDFSFNFM